MALEDAQILKAKNEKRCSHLIGLTLLLGVNLTAPLVSVFKDKLKIITVILIFGSLANIYGSVCFTIQYREHVDLIMESFCTMLSTIIALGKLCYLVSIQNRFYEILKSVQTHELINEIKFLSKGKLKESVLSSVFEEDIFIETPHNISLRQKVQRILDDFWTFATRQFDLYLVAVLLIIGYYFINSQITNAYNWYIGNANHTIALALPAYYPFWENNSMEMPYYLILTYCGMSANFVAGMATVSFDGIFITLALHGVMLFRILHEMIAFTTSPDLPKYLRLNYLRQCIDHNRRINEFCRELEHLFRHISLFIFFMSLVVLGVVMFQTSLSVESNNRVILKMLIYFTAVLSELFIYCVNGQWIINQGEATLFAWYDCEWYNESEEFKRLIKMMILRSNKVFSLNVSWFSTISLSTLLGLVKTSGSYFLFLRNMVLDD